MRGPTKFSARKHDAEVSMRAVKIYCLSARPDFSDPRLCDANQFFSQVTLGFVNWA